MSEEDAVSETVEPQPARPRMFGGYLEPVMLPWEWAAQRLARARHYWIATTRPNGRPHCRVVWGIWLDGAFYFSTGSLAAENLAENPEITVHLESGSEAVIVEGSAEEVAGDAPLLRRVADAYNAKYGWEVDPESPPGPFYRVSPRMAFGWVSDPSGLDGGSAFHGTATRWKFRERSG